MRQKLTPVFVVLSALSFGLCTPATTQAQAYPTKPIRLVVPFPAGGATDILARSISQKMGEKLGVSVIVDNKPGAGGTIGTEIAARSPADGYTLLLGTPSTHNIAPLLNPKITYNAQTDFTYLINLASSPALLLVPPNSTVRTVADLIALAKKNPGKLNYASSGNGTILHLQTELFKSMSGTFITHIPYRGTALAMPDLISGKIDLLIDVLPAALPHIHNGRARALAVSSARRNSLLPDLPTVDETLKGYVTGAWFGVFAPRGLSAHITDRLNSVLNETLRDAQIRSRLEHLGAEAVGGTAQEFSATVERERRMWQRIIAQRKITLE